MIRTVPDSPNPKEPIDLTEALHRRTGVVEIGSGYYHLPRPAELGGVGFIEVRGESVGTTRINAPYGAFNIRGRSKIKDFTIWRADYQNPDNTPKCELDATGLPIPLIGLFVEGNVSVADVDIDGYTLGIYEWASSSERGTNANSCKYRDVVIRGSGLMAMKRRGRDANGALVEGVRAYSSGEHGRFWIARDAVVIERSYAEQRARGVAEKDLKLPGDLYASWSTGEGLACHFDESGFFGSTYIATMLSSAHEDVVEDELQKDGTTKKVVKRIEYPPVISDNASNHSVYVGGYQESDQAPSIFTSPAIAVGGIGRWGGGGLRIDGPNLSSISVINQTDSKFPVTVNMGGLAGERTFLSFRCVGIDNGRALSVEVLPPEYRKGVMVQGARWILQIGNQRIPIWIENGNVGIAAPILPAPSAAGDPEA